jgi:hypothetical protein
LPGLTPAYLFLSTPRKSENRMTATESRAFCPVTQLLVTSEQSTFQVVQDSGERETLLLAPISQRPRLRREVVSLEHWLDLNA